MSNSSLKVGLNQFLNNLNSGAIVIDMQGRVICWNTWMELYSSIFFKQVSGQLLEEVFPELVKQRIYQVILSNIETGLPGILSSALNKYPFPLFTPGSNQNERIHQQINVTRLDITENSARYCLININDVSAAIKREKALEQQVKEKKKAELQLIKRTELLQSALYASNAGVFRFEITEKIVYLDEKAQYIFFNQPSDLVVSYSDWVKHIYRQDLQKVELHLHVAKDRPIGYQIDIEFRVDLGSAGLRWVMVRGVIGLNETNQKKNINGVLVDISRQKAHQKLVLKKEAAEVANHAKSAFLANISHELRTPMHGILSFANLGRTRINKLPREKLASYFLRITESGERLLYLLNDLLDLSKMEAGKMEMKFIENDLLVVVEQVINEQQARIDERLIKIEGYHQKGETVAEFDSFRLYQVMSNFLANAIQYTVAGSCISFYITQDHDNLKLEMRDQGVGIPKAEVEAIFNTFQQSSTTEDGSGGTGLGLAICKEIIEGHAGSLGCKNLAEGGASFYFSIPRKQACYSDC